MCSDCCIVGSVVIQTICQRQGDWRDGTQTNRPFLQCGAIQRTEGLQVTHGGLLQLRHLPTACHNKAFVVWFIKEGSWSAQYWIGRTHFLTGIWTERMMQAGETIEGASFVSSGFFITTKRADSTLFSAYFLWHSFFIICQTAAALVNLCFVVRNVKWSVGLICLSCMALVSPFSHPEKRWSESPLFRGGLFTDHHFASNVSSLRRFSFCPLSIKPLSACLKAVRWIVCHFDVQPHNRCWITIQIGKKIQIWSSDLWTLGCLLTAERKWEKAACHSAQRGFNLEGSLLSCCAYLRFLRGVMFLILLYMCSQNLEEKILLQNGSLLHWNIYFRDGHRVSKKLCIFCISSPL